MSHPAYKYFYYFLYLFCHSLWQIEYNPLQPKMLYIGIYLFLVSFCPWSCGYTLFIMLHFITVFIMWFLHDLVPFHQNLNMTWTYWVKKNNVLDLNSFVCLLRFEIHIKVTEYDIYIWDTEWHYRKISITTLNLLILWKLLNIWTYVTRETLCNLMILKNHLHKVERKEYFGRKSLIKVYVNVLM